MKPANNNNSLPETNADIASLLVEAKKSINARDAHWIMLHVTGKDAHQLITQGDSVLGNEQRERFLSGVLRRSQGFPLAYIINESYFAGYPFHITPAVMVPRPQTEVLAEWVCKYAAKIVSRETRETRGTSDTSDTRGSEQLRILELGTGSGAVVTCVALTLQNLFKAGSHAMPVSYTALEQSIDAIAVAKKNFARYNVEVAVQHGSWITDMEKLFPGQLFDIIFANPPYIAPYDKALQSDGVCHEPREALVSGTDGYADLSIITKAAKSQLAPGGMLALEHGIGQSRRCLGFLLDCGYAGIHSRKDQGGIKRIACGYKDRRIEG